MVNTNDQNDTIYQGMLTVIVSLIYLNNGMLPEGAYGTWQKLTIRIFDSIFEESGNQRVHSVDVNRQTLGYNGKTGIYR